MTAESQLALDQVVRRIEPLTRFSRESLILESENVRATTGKATWTFRIDISNDKESGKGRLPSRATALDSDQKLDETAQQTQKAAYNELPKRIQTWLSTNAQTDKELDSGACFNGPRFYGYEQRCSNCAGEGWLPCPNSLCRGGKVTCPTCDGKGNYDCPKCKGLIVGSLLGLGSSGKITCKGCGGSRKKNGNTCPTCNGQGKVTCPKCGGAKKLRCGKCAGQGTLVCSACNGAGRVPCLICDKTGFLHSVRTIACTVTPNWRVVLKDPRSEVVRELSKRSLSELRSLASVTQLPPKTEGYYVEREYDFECIITEIGVKASGSTLAIVGYGGKARIFDFKRIATILLADDLTSLQQAVADTRTRLWGKPARLLTATRQFLQSEVNVDIDNPTFLQEKIIDANYIQQVKQSLPKALQKLFASQIGLAFLVTAIAPALIFVVSHFTGLHGQIGNWAFVAPAVAAILSWVLLEMRSRTRMASMFQDANEEYVDGLLKKYRILWKARALGLVSAAVPLTIAGIALPLPLPL